MIRYGMVIDLRRCIGCQACTVACKAENFLPPNIKWNRVKDYETGKYPWTRRSFLPRPCMHCEDAACVEVCPTGATSKRDDGIVIVDYDKCTGCQYCIVACPYDARYLNDKRDTYFPTGLTPPEEFGYQKHKLGTVEKCTFCAPRIDEGIKMGLKPGVDWEATPACVNACPTGARFFGDLNDPDSEVSKLVRERHVFQLLTEMGTKPSVYYIPE